MAGTRGEGAASLRGALTGPGALIGGVAASSLAAGAGVGVVASEATALTRIAEAGAMTVGGIGIAGFLGAVAAAKMGAWARVPIEASAGDLFEGLAADSEGLVADKDGGLWAVVGLAGVDFGSVSDGSMQSLGLARRQLWRALAEKGVTIVQVSRRDAVDVSMEAAHRQEVRQWLHDCWVGGFGEVHGNRHYIMVGAKGRKARQDLEGAIRDVVENLAEYGAARLTNRGKESEVLSYFATLLNGRASHLAPATDRLGDRMANSEISFNLKSGRVVFSASGRRYLGACIGVKEWGVEDSAGLVNSLLTLPGHVEVVTVAQPLKKEVTHGSLRREKRTQNPLMVVSAIEEDFDEAAEIVGAGDDSFLDVQVLVFVYGEDEEQLDQLLSMVRRVVKAAGHEPGTDVGTIRYLWRQRLPGSQTNVRGRRLKCGDLANMLWWEAEPTGHDRCPWGEGPLQVFRTRTGSVFQVSVHTEPENPESPANSITLAPIGSGKTVLWQHLALGALKYHGSKVYFMDSGEGARVFIEACGGAYLHIGDEADVQLNPLQYLETHDDRLWAAGFLRQLAGATGENDRAALRESEQAIALLKSIKVERRCLRDVFARAFPVGGALRDGLETWATGEGLGKLYNGRRDTLDMETGPDFMGFAFDRILDEPRASASLVNYIMWRIRRAAERHPHPHMIVIDEAPRLTEDDYFAKNAKRFAREQRKKKGSVNFIYQDVEGLMSSICGPAVLGNAQTIFAFPNPNARFEDYKVLGFTEEQTAILRGGTRATEHLRRWVWIKRGKENVIADIDLSGMGKGLAIYRGGPEPVRVMHEMQQKFGPGWVAGYVEELG